MILMEGAWREDLVMYRPAKLNHVDALMMVIASLVNRSEGDELINKNIEVLEEEICLQ